MWTALSGAGLELLLYSGLASYGILNPIAAANVLTYADGQKLLFQCQIEAFDSTSDCRRMS